MLFAEKRMNEVQNGGFEQGLAFWLGADNVSLETGGRQHEGLVAAALGKEDNTCPASLFQDVRAFPLSTYKLQFAVSAFEADPGDLTVDVRYLDSVGADLGSALGCVPIRVQSETLGCADKGAYKTVIVVTEPAPFGTAAARIIFEKSPGSHGNYLLLDDVIFVDL
ncbi:MAG: hypothetical protein ACOX5M_00440 [Bacillota bacterium]|jgi:hypothetical protein